MLMRKGEFKCVIKWAHWNINECVNHGSFKAIQLANHTGNLLLLSAQYGFLMLHTERGKELINRDFLSYEKTYSREDSHEENAL